MSADPLQPPPAAATPGLPPAAAVSLDSCAREPIHIPGAIQPHGALIAFDPVSSTVVHASENLGRMIDLGLLPPKGRQLADLMGEPACAALLEALHATGGSVRHQVVTVRARDPQGETRALDAIVHSHRGVAMVELEPARADAAGRDWMQAFGETIDAMRAATDLQDLLDRIASRVKRLTGLDRVMVYRFDEEWNGHVLADVHEPGMEPYIDLHYPASDIPAQARELYRSNLVRYIADVGYTPVPVVPWIDNERLEPLDMSHATLRSVSPMHLQYLRNMGVGASLTMSLLVDGRLWGLIAAHHRTPIALSPRLREACSALAISAAYMVGWNAQRETAAATAARLEQQSGIVGAFNQVQAPLAHVIDQCGTMLLRLVGATGGAMWEGQTLLPFGRWPGGERGDSILRHVRHAFQTSIFDVRAFDVAALEPPLRPEELRTVCGLMALKLDAFATAGIVWLRPEHRREVAWGGDPDKPVAAEREPDGSLRLSPRSSFARWETQVRGRCRPWSELDREAARALLPLRQVLSVRDALARVSLSDQRFRGLVALQSDAYWQTEPGGQLVTLSKALPFDHGPVEGSTLLDLLARDCDADDVAALRDALSGGRAFRNLRLHARRADDDAAVPVELLLSGEPLRDRNGQLAGWHGTVTDVTPEATAQAAAQAALRQKVTAELSNLAKSRFLSQISHELRTPLNAVLGFSQLLLADETVQPAHHDQIEHIRRAGEWLLAMISDLLDLSRIETGNLALQLAPVDARALLDEVVDLVGPMAVAPRVRFVLPADGAPVWVLADAVRLKQVLVNLASNAVKYNRPDGEVRFGLAAVAGDPVRIEVHDTGVGLTPEQREQLFQPFNRLGRESQRIQGTGIGLVIAKQIVEAMEGTIDIRSEPGRGSCFTVGLRSSPAGTAAPAAADALQAPAGRAAPDMAPTPAPQALLQDEARREPVVLYVEDEPTNVQLLQAVVAGIPGTRFAHAESAEQGLELARTLRPALLLIDLNLPGQPGTWLLQAVRADEALRGTHCIAVTADAMPDTQRELAAAGFDDYWTKPLDLRAALGNLKGLLPRLHGRGGPAERDAPDFDAPDALQRLEAMTDAQLDRLDYGVVRMTRGGIAVAYNAHEARMAGLSPDRVLGRRFFEEIAPCSLNPTVSGRFDREAELDASFGYVFTLRMKVTPVRLRLLQSARAAHRYMLVDRGRR